MSVFTAPAQPKVFCKKTNMGPNKYLVQLILIGWSVCKYTRIISYEWAISWKRIIIPIRWHLRKMKKTYLGKVRQQIGIQKLAKVSADVWMWHSDVWTGSGVTFKHWNVQTSELSDFLTGIAVELVWLSDPLFALVSGWKFIGSHCYKASATRN